MLENGTFMLADCCSNKVALFNAADLTWSATGNSLAQENDEAGLTLLPDGTVLTQSESLRGLAAAIPARVHSDVRGGILSLKAGKSDAITAETARQTLGDVHRGVALPIGRPPL